VLELFWGRRGKSEVPAKRGYRKQQSKLSITRLCGNCGITSGLPVIRPRRPRRRDVAFPGIVRQMRTPPDLDAGGNGHAITMQGELGMKRRK
jgi:hypothetical protein